MPARGAILAIALFAIVPLGVATAVLWIRHAAVRDTKRAESWVETPCVITKSEFQHTTGSEPSRYLEFEYQYTIDGQTYEGDRLDLLIGSMGDDDVMEERVHETFPVGSKAVCYVAPNDPTISVFDRDHARGATRRLWLMAYPFLIVGLGFLALLIQIFATAIAKVLGRNEETPSDKPLTFGPPPRRFSPLQTAAVLAGPSGSQIAWLFVVGFFFIFVILDGPASYGGMFYISKEERTVPGTVTRAKGLDQEELGSQLYEYSFTYDVDGRTHTSTSYTRGRKYDKGDEVTIVYDVNTPNQGYIQGARPRNFNRWHSAIPLGVLLLLLFGLGAMYRHNFITWWLLKYGHVADAKWVEPSIREHAENEGDDDIATMESNYYFDVDGTWHKARYFSPRDRNARRQRRKKEEHGTVNVLYSRYRPKRNIIVDGELKSFVNPGATTSDLLINCTPAPLAVGAMLLLFAG